MSLLFSLLMRSIRPPHFLLSPVCAFSYRYQSWQQLRPMARMSTSCRSSTHPRWRATRCRASPRRRICLATWRPSSWCSSSPSSSNKEAWGTSSALYFLDVDTREVSASSSTSASARWWNRAARSRAGRRWGANNMGSGGHDHSLAVATRIELHLDGGPLLCTTLKVGPSWARIGPHWWLKAQGLDLGLTCLDLVLVIFLFLEINFFVGCCK
jgi:hypothetical protein